MLFADTRVIFLSLSCKPCLNQEAPACDVKKGKERGKMEHKFSIPKTCLTYFMLFCETKQGLPQRQRKERKGKQREKKRTEKKRKEKKRLRILASIQ